MASVGALFNEIEKQPAGLRHLFRGQSDASWGLVPSLYRIEQVNIHAGSRESSYSSYEEHLIQRFFREGLPYLPQLPRSYSNDRIIAQHFGVPTSFLDWSQDPLVALFFAVENWRKETDAAVFMLLPDANYLPEQVTHPIRHNAVSLAPPAIDRRIPAQKSRFTFHPYGEADMPFVPLDEREGMGNKVTNSEGDPVHGFHKIAIPRHMKRVLLGELLRLGVDRRNLFPGLDGVGSDLTLRAHFGAILD